MGQPPFQQPPPGPAGGGADRRPIEQALRESEQRFARFMQHLPGLAWIKDVQGRYVFVNDAAERAFRAPREQLYGKTDDDLFPPATAAQFRENDRRAKASESGVLVIETLEHSDGVVHHSLVSKFPIPGADGRPALVGGMAIDVTERKRAEDTLAESEGRFRQLAENINEVFWLSDPRTTQILYVSPAYERVWGRSCQSLYERPQSFLDAVHPDDRERARVAALEMHGRGEATDVEYRIVRPDGAVRWVRDRGFPIKDDAGRVYRFAGLAEDVTDKKEAEAALREADRRKDEFLAMLAHELRNPLAPITSSVQVLNLLGPRDGRLQDARDTIDRQVRHLARLVDDLLDVSRLSTGKVKLQKTPVELAVVLARAAETSRPLIDSRRHELTVAVPDESVWVDADPTRLAQVVANLLNNAAKYTEEGGRIGLAVEREGSEAVVRVRDNGVGIPAEMLGQVFDLFTQVDRGLDRAQGGLGIGLTLVRSLAEMHGGRVTAHSDGAGRGSEFVLRLPALPEPPRPAEPRGPRPAGRTQAPPRRVLVVDDNVDAAESLAVFLRATGHEVHTAYDGRAALRQAEALGPEVVVLDIGLPGMDGYEVARRLRQQEGLKQPFLVALTGYGQDEDRRRSAAAGFDVHLVKPADPDTLHDLVARGRAPSQ
jgi:PAS domain S-box-containing protein